MIDGQIDRDMNVRIDKWKDKWKAKQTDGRDGRTDKQTGRQPEGQIARLSRLM